MRQAGYLAAAGRYALQHHVERLTQDHARAKLLETELRALPYVESVLPVETNIVIFNLNESLSSEAFLRKLRERGVLASQMGRQTIRFVFHLDVGDTHLETLRSALHKLN